MSGSLKVSRRDAIRPEQRRLHSAPNWDGALVLAIVCVVEPHHGRSCPKWVAAFDRNRWLLSVQTRLD
jgi:hypothetical protein